MADEPVSIASLEISATPASATEIRQAKLEGLNQRIDQALRDNGRAEILVWALCTLLFLCGVALFVGGFILGEPIITGSGVVVEIGIIWPLRQIMKLREDNVRLQVLPSMLDILPPEEAKEQWKKWYDKWFAGE
jgi:Flp pilus assembly protein TadB